MFIRLIKLVLVTFVVSLICSVALGGVAGSAMGKSHVFPYTMARAFYMTTTLALASLPVFLKLSSAVRGDKASSLLSFLLLPLVFSLVFTLLGVVSHGERFLYIVPVCVFVVVQILFFRQFRKYVKETEGNE